MTVFSGTSHWLGDLLSMSDLDKEIEAGYVRERAHPFDPSLRILNYTEKAQYERRWNDVTRTCRGLVVNTDGPTSIVARPWAKFFNYGEHEEGSLDLTAQVEVLDKLDGSLGIIYRGPDGWAVATRGSFESEQALTATVMLREMLAASDWSPSPYFTVLVEIIYPDNRIVVDYDDFEGLVLLGGVHIRTGQAVGPSAFPGWPAGRAETFEAQTLAEALALPPRTNAEGVVVRDLDTGLMVKIKQEDYVRLHRIITGLSEKSVWEHLAEHGNIDGLIGAIPDEFHVWVRDKANALIEASVDIYAQAWSEFQQILDDLPLDFERGEFAARAKGSDRPGLLFGLLDGKDVEPSIWKELRPVGFKPMQHRTEEIA